MKVLVAFLLLALAPVTTTTRYELLGGRFRFDAPGSWLVAARKSSDSVSFIAFEVPRPPGGDTATEAAVNVMIDVALSHRHWDLKKYGDFKLNQLVGSGDTKVIDDHEWLDDHSRTALSQGVSQGVPIAVWDKIAVRDSIYLDVRTAMPASYGADSIWEAKYSAQLDSLIASFHIGNEAVFRASSRDH